MTKKQALYNPPEGADIKKYRVAEAVLDQETGEAIIDTSNGEPVSTGRTFEWTINRGETLNFPEYVANYLHKIYPFLRKVGPKKDTKDADKSSLGEEENE